jgi:hypothetical protein
MFIIIIYVNCSNTAAYIYFTLLLSYWTAAAAAAATANLLVIRTVHACHVFIEQLVASGQTAQDALSTDTIGRDTGSRTVAVRTTQTQIVSR